MCKPWLILTQPAVGVDMFIAFTCLEQTRAARTATDRPCAASVFQVSKRPSLLSAETRRRWENAVHATRAEGCEERACVREREKAMSDPIHSSPNQYCRWRINAAGTQCLAAFASCSICSLQYIHADGARSAFSHSLDTQMIHFYALRMRTRTPHACEWKRITRRHLFVLLPPISAASGNILEWNSAALTTLVFFCTQTS